MTLNDKRPAEAGRPVVNALQAEETNRTDTETQGPWDRHRQLEQRSAAFARLGLTQRGTDRFLTLALASTYALAARDAALSGAFQ